MNTKINKRITLFLEDYAPHSSHPFIKVDYNAWARHVYDELVTLKRTLQPWHDLPYCLGEIIINIVFAMTSEVVDGTSAYQDMQDSATEGQIYTDMHEIYNLV